jgi:P-type E1-E2 ATPase
VTVGDCVVVFPHEICPVDGLVSGDREPEVRYLADRVGITDVHAGQIPEQKVAITQAETARAPTLFVGDGINDAPALVAVTVGIAFGHRSDIATEAAGAVIMDTSLKRVDETTKR